MLPGDITLLTSYSRPALAPDGAFVIYAASRPDLRANRAVGQLWRLDLAADGSAAGAPRRLTRGIADSAPVLSPDGRTIAFLRPDARGRRQLHLVDARGGEPLALTELPLGVSEVVWSPDGTRLALTARVPEPGRYGTIEGLGAAAESPRRLTGPRWHANGLGYSQDRPAHVHVVAAASLESEPAYPVAPHPDGPLAPNPPLPVAQLTAGPAEHSGIAFSADGAEVLAVRAAHAAAAGDLRNEVIAIAAPGADGIDVADLRRREGGEPAALRVLVAREAGLTAHRIGRIGADGTGIGLLANVPIDGRDAIAPDVTLWRLAADGPLRITDPEALDIGSAGSGILALGEDVLVQAASRGRVHLVRVRPDGSAVPVISGDVVLNGADAALVPAADGSGGTRELILASAALPDSAGALLAAGPRADAPTVLVDGSAPLREVAAPVLPRELSLEGRSGYPVHGWLAVPEGAADAASVPTILLIHGGPHAAYSVALFDEVQTLVAAGYAVVYGNPRGSSGYGREHGRAVKGGFGTVDMEDVIDLLEGALAADPRLDGERLGIMGGSYGGYLTAWTIAHDHRFAGAIVERGFLDPLSFQGTSDIGTYFGDQYIGTSAEDIDRQSAFAAADAVRTPTFVIHSEQDLRCPLEQGTRYYSALRRAGVDTEMLIFPGEDHELTRAGQPRHRVERFEAVLEWWERHLGAGVVAAD